MADGNPTTVLEWAKMLRHGPIHPHGTLWWGEVVFMNHFWDVFCMHWIAVSHAAIIGRE